MKSRFLTFLCSSAMLLGIVACSDSDTNNPALSLPTIEGAPSASTLTTNNAIEATPEQISEDLSTLSETEELGSMVTEMSNFSSESPFGSTAEKTVSKKAMASSDEGRCNEINETEIDGNDTITFQWLNPDGSLLRVCESDYDFSDEESAWNQIYPIYNGSVFSEQAKGLTDSTTLVLNMAMTMYFDRSLNEDKEPTISSVFVNGNMLYNLTTSSTDFNAYAEFSGTVYNSSDTAIFSNFSMIYWFSDGRYKCDMSDFISSEKSEGEICKLINAEKTVGSLYLSNDEVYVKDADGKYVGDQPTNITNL